MLDLFTGAGIFIYPLGLCSLIGAFVIFERGFALRRNRVIPRKLLKTIDNAEPVPEKDDSVLGRLARIAEKNSEDDEGLKPIARLEVNRLERGLFFLEVIVSAAPLIGLLGTVTGLVQVFSHIDADTGLPEPSAFVQGVALALTTTVLGLAIAIPCLVASSYFQRKIETFTVQLVAVIEQIRNRQRKR